MSDWSVSLGRVFFALALVLGFSMLGAAPADSSRADSSWRNLAPKLYIQDETYSDIDYVRTEITFVNYVRDPKEADIHLIITSSTTGGGGQEYTLDFKGLGAFKDIGFVLRHTTKADATSDEIRTALVAAIKRGLAPYIARTGLRDRLAVSFQAPTTTWAVTDPWKSWVFAASVYAYPQGDETWSQLYYYLNGDISRTTERAKLDINGGASMSDNRYVMDSTVVEAVKRSYYGDASCAWKLSNHFAAGGEAAYNNSEYGNLLLGLSASPRLEYSITPYPEYTRHKVYVRFAPAVLYNAYYETTLYGRMNELRIMNAVRVGVTATRRWGTVDFWATGSHYLHDFSKNRLSLYGDATLRIVAGLSLGLGGSYSFIHDQLALRKGAITDEERLLRLKEQATGYSYYGYVSLTYTFGSIYNNIVNPIF